MTMKLKILSIAALAVATLPSAGSVFARTPVHGPGSSHNPIIVRPVHGPGSSHNPIIRNPDCSPGDRKCPNQPTLGRRPRASIGG